ncbi:hypothetical protein [Clostridium sardiniense]|uniref:hypothetical protein n=1 Tax=Clostridium sardiniense TaxID=29369 RepID=UPI00195DE3C2|nr:hypothetical protein [Clostridium sardiniense]MBM7836330.1 nucleoside 2-deoxyribosyltransferase [Clostridium sardiniense]
MEKRLYLAGGIMSRGEILAREEEYNKLQSLGLDFDIYSPVKNKSINDKSNVTEEENNKLSEKIVKADMERLWSSDLVIAEYQPYALGTISEIAILYMMKQFKDKLDEILKKSHSADEVMNEIVYLRNLCDKDVRIHSSDIRNTDIPEIGFKRSHSYNQFCLGLIEDVTKGKSIQDLNIIIKEVEKEYENNY